MNLGKECTKDRNTLDEDRSGDFGVVPYIGNSVAPVVVRVALVAFVLPDNADGSDDCDTRKSLVGFEDCISGSSYTTPRLMVMHRPSFSFLFMSSFHVIIHGKRAKTKSMMTL